MPRLEKDERRSAPAKPLSPQQLAFVAAYLANGGNANGAAQAAGYVLKHANVGFNLVRRPHIKAEIERRRSELLQNTIASPERVLRAYEAQAFLDPRKLYNEQNRVKPMRELDDDAAFGIGKFKVDKATGEVTEVEIDRNTALAGIINMMGWKKPAQLDVQVRGTVSINAVRAIMERAFAPPREVEAPEVIPIEQVTHVLIDIEPPPLPECVVRPALRDTMPIAYARREALRDFQARDPRAVA